jgi:hypothetical protein
MGECRSQLVFLFFLVQNDEQFLGVREEAEVKREKLMRSFIPVESRKEKREMCFALFPPSILRVFYLFYSQGNAVSQIKSVLSAQDM